MKMRLTIDMDNVNYASIIRMILPYVKKEDIPAILNPVINRANEPGVLEGFLKLIPKSVQDKLVLDIFKKNRHRILRKGRQALEKVGIEADVTNLSLNELRVVKRSEVKDEKKEDKA